MPMPREWNLSTWIERPNQRAVMNGFAGLIDLMAKGALQGIPVPVLIGPPGSGKSTTIEKFISERQEDIHCVLDCPGFCRPANIMLIEALPTPKNVERAWWEMHRFDQTADRFGKISPFRRTVLSFVDNADNLDNARGKDLEIILARFKAITEEHMEIFVLVGTSRLKSLLQKLPNAHARFRFIDFETAAGASALLSLPRRRPRL